MDEKKISLISLNMGIVIVDALMVICKIYVYNYVADDTLEILANTFVFGVLILSVLVLFYGNYKLLKSIFSNPKQKYDYVLEDIDTAKECIDALNKSKKSCFIRDVELAKDQVERLGRKQEAMRQILFQKCEASQEDMVGMKRVVEEAEMLVYDNIKHMLSRMAIFDEEGYHKLMQYSSNGELSTTKERKAIYYGHFAYVKQQLDKNEAILIQYDHLLTEISKMGDEDSEESDRMAHMRDVVNGMKQMNAKEEENLEDLEEKYQQMRG